MSGYYKWTGIVWFAVAFIYSLATEGVQSSIFAMLMIIAALLFGVLYYLDRIVNE